MKEKNIKKVLKNKIDDWLNHIDDKEIKNIIKDEAIVTGGSIASMLMDEKINDFDIYFKSKNAVKKICQYYKKILDENENKDRESFNILDGKDWFDFDYYQYANSGNLDDISYAEARAGHKLSKDRIKIFPCDENGYLKIEKDDEKKYFPEFISPNAITLSDNIQLIIRFHGNPNEIHENYDFVHVTNHYTYKNNYLNLRKDALKSLIERDLKYIGSKYPITSLIRTKKYIKRGFSISAGEYLKMAYQVSKLDLDDVVVLEDQLAGVDIVYFNELIKILKDKVENNEDLNYNKLSKIIDKIFFEEDD